MKKLFSIASLILIASAAFSQAIVTTSASFPSVGQMQIEHNDSIATGVTPGSAGASQTWNFSTLASHYDDTSTVMAVASTPSGANYPTASVAVKQGNTFYYLTSTATQVDVIGISGNFLPGGTSNVDGHFSTAEIYTKSGLTYNSTFNYTSLLVKTVDGAGISVPGLPVTPDSIRIHRTNVVSKTIDGWGTVSNPKGSFPCLRLKTTNTQTIVVDALITFAPLPSTWVNSAYTLNSPTNTDYDYIDDYSTISLVSLNMDTTSNTVSSAAYREYNAWPAGISQVNKPTLFRVYPNPASSNINLLIGGLADGNYAVSVTDISGKIIFKSNYAINPSAVTPIDLSKLNLPSGSYFASVADAKQNLQTIKFEVAK